MHSLYSDRDFRLLSKSITQMGALVENQVIMSLRGFLHNDSKMTVEVVTNDRQVDGYDDSINALVMRILERHQSVAYALREAVTALKIVAALERIGDLAKNIARRGMELDVAGLVIDTSGLVRMGALVQAMVKDVLDAYLDRDIDRALAVWKRDSEVDSLHKSLFRELLTYMMEDPRLISQCITLLFVFKNLERIGDHTTNIAENIYYLVQGEKIQDQRLASPYDIHGDISE